VYDTAKAHSVLSQLGVKDQLAFLDTSRERPAAAFVVMHSGLAVTRMSLGGGGGASYAAPLAEYDQEFARGWVDFTSWWNRLVFQTEAGNFTRGDLVLALAHQDGGAHVDPELSDAYAALSRGNLLGWYSITTKEPNTGAVGVTLGPAAAARGESFGSPAPANVRQVAFELDQTFTQGLPELV
jgi:hypothetical protein